MNFYKHYMGDYQRDTMRLSMTEDGAYRRLLDEYYATEEPLPADHEECYRAARAISAAERKAVDKILEKYFSRGADGYHHRRVDEEIAKAKKQAETNRRIAEEREAKRKRDESLDEPLEEEGTNEEPNHSHSHSQTPDTKASSQGKKGGKPPTPKFTKPTVQQVAEYCRERQNTVNPQRFVDHYESNGWKVGKNSMKDWKASVRTWENREIEGKNNGAKPSKLQRTVTALSGGS